MTTPSVATLVHESLGERLYRSLRDLILSQAYPPGSKLNVEQLRRSLGVNPSRRIASQTGAATSSGRR